MLIGQSNGQMKFEDDPRHVIKTGCSPGGSGAITLAWVINSDYSVSTVTIDDTDNQYANYKAVIDATEEDLDRVREREAIMRIDEDGYYAKVGDIVEVVKGRKFAKGALLKVTDRFEVTDRYGRVQAYYLKTDSGKINSDNVIVHCPNIWVAE